MSSQWVCWRLPHPVSVVSTVRAFPDPPSLVCCSGPFHIQDCHSCLLFLGGLSSALEPLRPALPRVGSTSEHPLPMMRVQDNENPACSPQFQTVLRSQQCCVTYEGSLEGSAKGTFTGTLHQLPPSLVLSSFLFCFAHFLTSFLWVEIHNKSLSIQSILSRSAFTPNSPYNCIIRTRTHIWEGMGMLVPIMLGKACEQWWSAVLKVGFHRSVRDSSWATLSVRTVSG